MSGGYYLTESEAANLVDPSVAHRCKHCQRLYLAHENTFPFCDSYCKAAHTVQNVTPTALSAPGTTNGQPGALNTPKRPIGAPEGTQGPSRGLLRCCRDTIAASIAIPTQGDVLACGHCGDFMRFSVGGWYHVPFVSIQQTEARQMAAQQAGPGYDLQAAAEKASPLDPPTRPCTTCNRIATWIDDTAGGLRVFVCPEKHITTVKRAAA